MRKICLFLSILLALHLLSCEEETPDPILPKLTIRDAQANEGNANTVLTTLVQLSSASEEEVKVNYSTNPNEAEAEKDYEDVNNATLVFSPGEVEKEITINLINDEFRESEETFFIILSDAVNAEIIRATGTMTIYNDDSEVDVSSLNIPNSGFTSPESYPGMTLVWSDEFQASVISDDWKFEIGDGCDRGICGWGNNELEYYRRENAFIASDEYLVIQARRENYQGKQYTSSRMITQGIQKFRYGRIDIRAAMPSGQGIWPALWMLGENISTVGWPACGEIDIMEIVGHEPNTIHGTLHWDNNGSYASSGQSTEAQTSAEDEFHVYSIIWDQSQIKWLLDDVQYNFINTSNPNFSEFRNDFFFIFNIAVGGNWPGSPNASTVFPQRMVVDYVRVFQ